MNWVLDFFTFLLWVSRLIAFAPIAGFCHDNDGSHAFFCTFRCGYEGVGGPLGANMLLQIILGLFIGVRLTREPFSPLLWPLRVGGQALGLAFHPELSWERWLLPGLFLWSGGT